MKSVMERLSSLKDTGVAAKICEDQQLYRRVSALYGLLTDLYGPDRLVLKAGKLHALDGMRSDKVSEQVLALQRLVFEDPTIDHVPAQEEIPAILEAVEEEIADRIARRSVEEQVEKQVAEKMRERHDDYMREIRLQVLKEEAGPETPQTLQRLAQLEKMDEVALARPVIESLRPRTLSDIVGQDRPVRALLAKIASPFPQHVLLYGPPGVGKTTAARLVLEMAKALPYTPFQADAPFVEADGSTLRWDPREITNPLLGSVHDPIYQGARRDLAEGGIPEPKLGLVTEAHGGVLFLDEIGELDYLLQNKLLKVLEDKRVEFDSPYFDPQDEQTPKYVKKLFEQGAPADFVLIGATTRSPEEITPALRSRCAEIFFEPLSPTDIEQIVREAAERLQVSVTEAAIELISTYTIEGRKAVGILADAFSLALNNNPDAPAAGMAISEREVREVIQTSRLVPSSPVKASATPQVGHVFGLGVAGFLGSVLEIEAIAFPAREPGKGKVRFNEAAGSMARDAVFNATAVVRKLSGLDPSDYDVHVNIVGGGRVDGPSAGAAVTIAILSALTERLVRQDVAITGEVSIQGCIKEVGGIPEKIYGARQAGMKRIIVPAENANEIPDHLKGIEVVTVSRIEEVCRAVLTGGDKVELAH